MSKKIKNITLILILILIAWHTNVLANTLKLFVNTNKESYKIGDEVKVNIDWTDGMQSVDFTLKYDSNKLEFVSASFPETFYNADTKGVIYVTWLSFDEKDITSLSFIFKAKSIGNCVLSISNPTFSNGNLEMPDEYDIQENGTKTINITNSENISGETKIPEQDKPMSNGSVNTENNNKAESIQEKQEVKPTTQEVKSGSDKSTISSNLPKTGLGYSVIALIAIVVVSLVFSYKKYRNMSGI